MPRYEIEFTRAEMEAVWQAAERRGMTTAEYIKRMAVEGNANYGAVVTTSGFASTVWK